MHDPEPPFCRKPIRLPAEAYRTGDPFLVTICTADRKPILGDARLAGMVARRLDSGLADSGGPVVAYCVMPDHVHVVLAGCTDVVRWIREFKAATAAQAGRLGHVRRLWQRRFHDRCLARSSEPLAAVSRYIAENPVRAGLVDRAEDWPYTRVCSVL